MESVRENKMGSMPMFKLIISMSLPAMFSMIIQAMYNIVDSIFVSRISENALTAVTLAFPVQMVLISVGVGTGVGLNSLISRRLGEGEYKKANLAASHGIILGIISWIVFAILGLTLSRTFISLFTDSEDIIQMGTVYLVIVSTFSFGVFIQISVEKILQATGNMIYPMLIQLTGAVTNIILDPILIFGLLGFPKMGMAGAAIATVIGQILAMCLSLILVFFKEHEVKITLKGFKFDFRTVKNIYGVGFPAIMMQSIASVMITFINGILISFSQTAVAVFGVYFRLQSFIFMPVFGITQGVMPIMGYNFGAKNKKRLIEALKIAIKLAVVIMFIGTVIFFTFPKQMLLIFNASYDMISIGTVALRIISSSFVLAALGIMFSTMFQAIGMGIQSLITSILRQLVVLIPVSYLMSLIGLTYVWLAFPIAELFTFLFSIIIFKKVYDTKIRYL